MLDPRITVAHLLTHSSGFPAWRPVYAEATGAWGTAATRTALLHSAWATPLEAEPGTRHCYSDLGMLALLGVLEAATEQDLSTLFRDRVQHPAGIADLRWGWPGAAATEVCPVRGVLVEGIVHDLNCASLGGISTHAGLFGTAAAVAGLADRLRGAVADPERFPELPGRALGQLWALRGPGSHRGGWDAISAGYSSTGQFFPADTVGHLGYTGTSVWVAPSRRTTVVLLTNRVHPVDDKEPIRKFRPSFHDAIARELGWADRPGAAG
jgi:CubicO group peptidase (beta-lactamase class C family)